LLRLLLLPDKLTHFRNCTVILTVWA